MFGYVHISPEKLTEEELGRYRSAYCGLCRTLGRRYGPAARMILNYDLTFLAVLLSDGREPICENHRCAVHPLQGRWCCEASAALDTAADVSVILTWWQLQDGIADSSLFQGLKYRFLALFLRRAYRKARAAQPSFDESTRQHLAALAALEKENCPSIDRAADTFAQLLAACAGLENEERKRRVLREMLYHLGRWIYLVDAADDLKKDIKSGSYNPLSLRYEVTDGALSAEDRENLSQTLDGSIRTMAAAFELADFGCWRTIIESVVYEGLYVVGAAVLNGTFHRQKQERADRNPTRKAGT